LRVVSEAGYRSSWSYPARRMKLVRAAVISRSFLGDGQERQNTAGQVVPPGRDNRAAFVFKLAHRVSAKAEQGCPERTASARLRHLEGLCAMGKRERPEKQSGQAVPQTNSPVSADMIARPARSRGCAFGRQAKYGAVLDAVGRVSDGGRASIRQQMGGSRNCLRWRVASTSRVLALWARRQLRPAVRRRGHVQASCVVDRRGPGHRF